MSYSQFITLNPNVCLHFLFAMSTHICSDLLTSITKSSWFKYIYIYNLCLGPLLH